jgi:hypothetical protein
METRSLLGHCRVMLLNEEWASELSWQIVEMQAKES